MRTLFEIKQRLEEWRPEAFSLQELYEDCGTVLQAWSDEKHDHLQTTAALEKAREENEEVMNVEYCPDRCKTAEDQRDEFEKKIQEQKKLIMSQQERLNGVEALIEPLDRLAWVLEGANNIDHLVSLGIPNIKVLGTRLKKYTDDAMNFIKGMKDEEKPS